MRKDTKKRIVAIGMGLVLGLSSLVVPGGTSEAASKLKVTCSKTVAINCTTKVKTNMKAKFSSSNKKIATVTSKGVVKGKKPGKVKITVVAKSNKKLKKTVTITVKKQLVVTAPENAKATLESGKTVKIKTNLSSTFKSSNNSVATVSKAGVVTAQMQGTAKITVTSKKYNLKKTVTITVKGVTSSTQLPTTQEPSTEIQTTETPTTKESTTEIQSTETQTTQEPATENSTTEEVTTEILTTQELTTEIQTTEEPTTETPTTEEPTTDPVPVGITAEYKGKTVEGEPITRYGITVNMQYSDNTTKIIDSKDIEIEDKDIITENGRKYDIYNVKYQEFNTELRVEKVIVENVTYPIYVMAEYTGGNLNRGENLNLEDVSAQVLYSDGSVLIADSSKIYAVLFYDYAQEGTNEYEFNIVYDYYFEYNGEILYMCSLGKIYVPYE